MDRVKYQQEVADAILKIIYPIDINAIVAGGAPRDWYFGTVAKDIDVFVYDTCNTVDFQRKLEHQGFKVNYSDDGKSLPEHYKKNPHLRGVFDCVFYNEQVQFLLMAAPTFTSVLDQFPLSICKAWYKNGKVSVDRDFKRSVKHQAIVKTNPIYANPDKYVNKILAKFPEFKYYESWENLAVKLLDA